MDRVLGKVLGKLEDYMDRVTPEKITPQVLKHVTGTLKDIRELQTEVQTDSVIRVEFSVPEWSK